ncbi:hypothetical protein [Streptomyces wuyuanensis]|uniref:hypothetical protein n=1 Tax=Streptomyces wuyuanensis TaxID=1196353 RepID=UPI00341399AE
MPSPSSRWHRVLAVVAALTAVLTGALLCSGTSATAVTGASPAGSGAATASAAGAGGGAGVESGAAGKGRWQSTAVAPPTSVAPASAVAPTAAVPAGGERLPGCGEGTGDGGLSPATPPRGSAAHELLPALPATANGATGCSAAGDAVLELAPERAPPALAAPGPIDLSVLRV